MASKEANQLARALYGVMVYAADDSEVDTSYTLVDLATALDNFARKDSREGEDG